MTWVEDHHVKPRKPKNVKQIQLPSGKVIDVLCFPDQPQSDRGGRGPEPDALERDLTALPAPTPDSGEEHLHVCEQCAGVFVYPLGWAEAGQSEWEVLRRCPECEWCDSGIFSQEAVERFDIELDEGAEVLLRDLQQLAHANMVDDIERFVAALHRDLIVPADF
jgi:hypothetical protein